jgi:2-dehydropantoate 2-reductase
VSDPKPTARIAVVGGGAVGGYLSALLHDAGHDVTLCVRTPLSELVVERDGVTRAVGVTIATSPDGMGPADVLVLAVKGQDTPTTAPWIDALAGPETIVVVAQNGVDHRARVAPLAPGSAILPILVYFTIEPIGRGRLRHSVGNRLVVPADPVGERFTALLAGTGLDVEATGDFLTAAWRKFLGNVLANPVTALTLRRSEVFRDEAIAPLSRSLLSEAIAVGRAEGALFAGDELEQTLELFAGVPAKNGTSMLFDRLALRPLEHELITGVVVAAGRRHAIPTPANDVVYALLAALDRGIRSGAVA